MASNGLKADVHVFAAMDAPSLSTLTGLSSGQKQTLKRANILTATDLVVLTAPDIAKRCRIPHNEAVDILKTVCDELAPPLRRLGHPFVPKDQVFTTGDATLDGLLGGGIRTRKLWEVVGESAAGKTQLVMQLSLCVQLPERLGGVSGAACFLSTSWILPTNRLLEMIDAHPNLSPTVCGLSDVHFMKTPTVPVLRHVLANTLPAFMEDLLTRPSAKPIKLVVVDALTELFHVDAAVSTATLTERSRSLAEISTLLHSLASRYNIAIIAVNEVTDAIDRGPAPGATEYEVAYRDQARLFGRAESIPGEGEKEAALGLVWANQVNARMMLSRTRRVRYLDDAEARAVKRRRLDADTDVSTHLESSNADDQPIRIRRLTVIFNAVGRPGSLDYVVTAAGIATLPEEPGSPVVLAPPSPARKSAVAAIPPSSSPAVPILDIVVPTSDDADDFGHAQVSSEGADAENGPGMDGEDEWEAYWKDTDLGSDIYSQVNLSALPSSSPNG